MWKFADAWLFISFWLLIICFCSVFLFLYEKVEKFGNGTEQIDVTYDISSFSMKSEKRFLGFNNYLVLDFADGTSKVIDNIYGLKVKKGQESVYHEKKYKKTNKTARNSIVIFLKESDYKSFNHEFTSTFNIEPIYD